MMVVSILIAVIIRAVFLIDVGGDNDGDGSSNCSGAYAHFGGELVFAGMF